MPGYDPKAYRMGLEFEYQLIDEHGNPRHYRELSFPRLKEVIAASAAPALDYLAVKYPGSDQRSYYLEGYDLVDDRGTVTDLHVKGIEISTPIAPDFATQEEHLVRLYTDIREPLRAQGLTGSCYGAHRVADEYVGPRGGRDVVGWASAETAMMTWGIHVNASFPDPVEERLDRAYLAAKFDWFGPALVLLSADTPIRGAGPWRVGDGVGKSERSYRRSFTRRPLYFRDDQHHRKEVTCFDVTNRLDLVRAYSAVSVGLMLEGADIEYLPPSFADRNMREVARYGYASRLLDRHFRPVDPAVLAEDALARAARGLVAHDLDVAALKPLEQLVDACRCPADDTLDEWLAAPDWPRFLAGRHDLISR